MIPTEVRLLLGVPLHVLLSEATDLAAYVRRLWDPSDGRPGLSSAVRRFDVVIAEDLLGLVEAVQAEHTAFRLTAEPPVAREIVEREEAVLDELTAVLEFYFDDGVEDEHDAQLAAISDLYGTQSRSDDALASALFDFSALAEAYRGELDGLGGFVVTAIDEAPQLAEQIRGRSARDPSVQADQARRHMQRRNQLATVLDRKVKLIRAAARFAFRQDPMLAREAGSAYGRRTRAARRLSSGAQISTPEA